MQLFTNIAHGVAAVGLSVAVFFGFHHTNNQVAIAPQPVSTTFVYTAPTPTVTTTTTAIATTAKSATTKKTATKVTTKPITTTIGTTTTKPVVVPTTTAPITTTYPPVVITPPIVINPTTTTPVASIPTPSPITSGTMQWGIFLGNGAPSSLSSFTSQVGASPSIQVIFSPWSDGFPDYISSICSANKTLLLYWENSGYSVSDIIAGKYDTYIKNFSSQAAAYKCPVMLSLFHEMNGDWDDWDGANSGGAPNIIAAWKHVHDLVTASNVKWIWVVNNESVPNTAGNRITDYWPGSSYVDYIGVDGFNFGNPWQTFGQVFDSAVATVQQYNKPIYLSSIGSVAGTQKAAWITEGLGTHVKTYKNVVGWVWFNESQSQQNWLINSDAASLAAFSAVVK